MIPIADLALIFTDMKKCAFLFSLLLCLNIYGQKNKFYTSSWHKEGADEISTPSDNFTSLNKGKLYCFLSNDEYNLILDIIVEDESIQTRILKEGMTIWIDMDCRKDKNMGVRFPIGSQQLVQDNNSKLNSDVPIVTPLSQANTIEIIGFTGENSRRLPAENNDSFNGFLKLGKDGVLNYRMSMPLEKIPVRNSKDGKGAMPFNIGIEYGMAPNGSQTDQGAAKPPVISWVKNIRLSSGK